MMCNDVTYVCDKHPYYTHAVAAAHCRNDVIDDVCDDVTTDGVCCGGDIIAAPSGLRPEQSEAGCIYRK